MDDLFSILDKDQIIEFFIKNNATASKSKICTRYKIQKDDVILNYRDDTKLLEFFKNNVGFISLRNPTLDKLTEAVRLLELNVQL